MSSHTHGELGRDRCGLVCRRMKNPPCRAGVSGCESVAFDGGRLPVSRGRPCWRAASIIAVALGIGIAGVMPPMAAEEFGPVLTAAVAALIGAYPDQLSHRDGNDLVWRDGTRMPIDDGVAKNHADRLKAADIEDMLAQVYPVGVCSYGAPKVDVEPGRIRNEAFFRAMYGDSAAEVSARLLTVDWFGTAVSVTSVNGVDRALLAVRDELSALPAPMQVIIRTTAGTFNWRVVAGTDRLSVHSFGAAIDLNVAFADYWLWSSPTGRETDVPAYRNRIPHEVVEIFERHGFVWGGKWYHFDTMHFEYRPELLALATTVPC